MTIILVNPGIPLAVVLDPQHLPTRSHRPIAILNHFKLWWDHSKKVQISMENKDVPPHFAEGAWFFFQYFSKLHQSRNFTVFRVYRCLQHFNKNKESCSISYYPLVI